MDQDQEVGPKAGPGKSTMTSRLSAAPQVVFRVADPETARALGESFGGSGRMRVQREARDVDGARDSNGVAEQAEAAVDKAAGSSGTPLPTQVQRQFESSLGADLSSVRVHTGAESQQAAHAVGAKAYTVGQDIHFGAGKYQPDDPFGMHLLAHEVAHTVQQSGRAQQRQHKLEVSTPYDAAEHEADLAADAMVRGAPASPIGLGGAVMRHVSRDADEDLKKQGEAGERAGSDDVRVQVINIHTTMDDESEVKSAIAAIDAATPLLERHPTNLYKRDSGNGPFKSMLVENVDGRFALEQYLATVSDSGNAHSQYAASYSNTRADYGKFQALYGAFIAAGGTLKSKAHTEKMAAMGNNVEFSRARTQFQGVRDQLENDRHKISEGQIATTGADEALKSAIYKTRAATAKARADKKKTELNTLNASISSAVETIMTVGKIASAAYSGILAVGAGGLNMDKMVEANPQIDPANPVPPPQNLPGGPAAPAPSLAPPDPRRFMVQPAELHSPEDELAVVRSDKQMGVLKPNDTRSYSMPSQTWSTVKDLGSKGANLLGGPKEMLTAAIKMLEQANIDRITTQIEAAQEDNNLSEAASAAADMKAKRLAYQEKLTILVNNVENLLNHKKQMDTAVEQMIAAAKKQGASKELTGAIRLVGAGDQFLSQVDLTISLGQQQQQKGAEARLQRYNINDEAFSTGTVQGPGQVHYWTVAKENNDYHYGDKWVGTRHNVELKSSGKDSLQTGRGANSTQFDVGKSLQELQDLKTEVQTHRNEAQSALDIGVGAGHSSN
jgi:Domain of unknown function (DUF4157)